MDIASLSMGMSQNKIMTAVNTAMLDKTLDLAEAQTSMLTESMAATSPSLESLVYPTMGTQIDMTV